MEMCIVVPPGLCWFWVAHQKLHPGTQFAYPPPLNGEISMKIQLLNQCCLNSSEPLIASSSWDDQGTPGMDLFLQTREL